MEKSSEYREDGIQNYNETISGTNSPADSTLDENYTLYKRFDSVSIDPLEAKKVLRKIDLRILPILFVTYMLQYLDKNSLNFASVYGLAKGTGLKGQDYSWLGRSGRPM